nr:MAG TPA: hypothetical protein [Bacteriophage sp.]
MHLSLSSVLILFVCVFVYPICESVSELFYFC